MEHKMTWYTHPLTGCTIVVTGPYTKTAIQNQFLIFVWVVPSASIPFSTLHKYAAKHTFLLLKSCSVRYHFLGLGAVSG